MSAPPLLTNPYIGPRSFQRNERLYGRDRETRDLTALLVAERIVLLNSPSGAGKTSLIQAALIPRLLAREFFVRPLIRVGRAPAVPNANRYLLSTLSCLEEDPNLPADRALAPEQLATLSLRAYLAQRPPPTDSDGQVLIFDQFEEVLTADPTDEAEKHAFFAQLGDALRDTGCWALFAIREDYVAPLAPLVRPLPTRLANHYRLGLLGLAAAKQAMRGPAETAGVTFADDAADQLAEDLAQVMIQDADGDTVQRTGLSVEPVQLQVVCRRLWDLRFGEAPQGAAAPLTITRADLSGLVAVDQALADYYDAGVACAVADEVGQRMVRTWFDRELITRQDIRSQVLRGAELRHGVAAETVRALVNAYLVRAEERRGSTWYELAHDRLIGPVRASNKDWFARHLSPLQRQAEIWDEASQPDSLLFRGPDLQAAEAWLAGYTGVLMPNEQQFLARCREERQREQERARQARHIRNLAIGATIAALLALILAGTAFAFYTSAEANRRQAEQNAAESNARQLAAQALSADDPQRGLLLAVEASNQVSLPEPVSALYQVLADSGGLPLRGHTDEVSHLLFSPDGRYLASGSYDHTVILWDMARPTKMPLLLPGHSAPITTLAFSPDGRRFASADEGANILLWDLASPAQPLALLPGHTDTVTQIAFSPDGATLASASFDGQVRLWSMADPAAEPTVLPGEYQALYAMALSPDGQLLAAGGDDQQVFLWDLRRPASAALPLEGHQARITSLAFSPGGDRLASASKESGQVLLWDARQPDADPRPLNVDADGVIALAFSPDGARLAVSGTGQEVWVKDLSSPDSDRLTVLKGHQGSAPGLAFSPDGATLLTASDDATARLWDLRLSEPQAIILRGHSGAIAAAAFSPDGQTIVTGGLDTTVRLWSVPTLSAVPLLYTSGQSVQAVHFSPDGQNLLVGNAGVGFTRWAPGDLTAGPTVLNPAGDVAAVAISPDQRYAATATFDGQAQLWDLLQPDAAPTDIGGNDEPIFALAFSPDSAQLAAGLESGVVALLATGDPGAAQVTLPGSGQTITALAYSPDGAWLASGADDGRIQLWDRSRLAAEPRSLIGHSGAVRGLTLSPDSQRLASASDDASARVWDLASATSLSVLSGHSQPVTAVAFSPDGQRLATASVDKTVRIWELASPDAALMILLGHEELLNAVAFSPDGSLLASADSVGWVRLWTTHRTDMIDLACETAGRNLTNAEWQQSFGDLPYRKTCADLPISASLIDDAATLIGFGEITRALALVARVNELGLAAEIPARSWDALCWQGSLAGYAAEVAYACDQALVLDPTNGQLYDRRGLNRALRNDLAGARSDFLAYISWAEQNSQDEDTIALRRSWVEALTAGESPFDPAMLNQVRWK